MIFEPCRGDLILSFSNMILWFVKTPAQTLSLRISKTQSEGFLAGPGKNSL
jgi:hypothetical protein